MFGRREGDFNPRRFWSWFAHEHHGLANGIEALQRGETDAEWLLIGLNERLHRYDPALSADLARSAEGHCQLIVTGAEPSVAALLHAAPQIAGWRFLAAAAAPASHRIPFRLAPRPSNDASPIEGRYEAYAMAV